MPGIGPHQASRIAFWFLNLSRSGQQQFIQSLNEARQSIVVCPTCFMHFEASLGKCTFCQDPSRDQNVIAIIAKEQDALALEATGEFKGVYHVLGGTLSLRRNPDHLTLPALLRRLQDTPPKEAILVFDQTSEGEATAAYVEKSLRDKVSHITHLGRGVPSGGAIEYADSATILGALENRK